MSQPPAPFIVGVGRSGTTLLRLMLDAHPELAIPSETHFLNDIIRKEHDLDKDQFLRTLAEAATWPNMGIETAALKGVLDELWPFAVPDAIRAFYRLYAGRFGKGRWGDKTPGYRTCMLGIERLLPEAHFIHIIRDGRDTALSYQGLWFGPGDDIEAQARFWVAQVRLARQQSTALQHYMEVKFEELVTEPAATLGRICEYVGLAFHPKMLEYHEFASSRLAEFKRPFGPPGTPSDIGEFVSIHDRVKTPPDPRRIGRWRTEMPEVQRRCFEAIAGPLLVELGYAAGLGRGQ
jgi:Sulfotransferase family